MLFWCLNESLFNTSSANQDCCGNNFNWYNNNFNCYNNMNRYDKYNRRRSKLKCHHNNWFCWGYRPIKKCVMRQRSHFLRHYEMQEIVRHGSCPTRKLSDKTQPNDTRICRRTSVSDKLPWHSIYHGRRIVKFVFRPLKKGFPAFCH